MRDAPSGLGLGTLGVGSVPIDLPAGEAEMRFTYKLGGQVMPLKVRGGSDAVGHPQPTR